MSRYLLTGSSGLVGSHLLPILSKKNLVYCLSRKPPPLLNSNVVHLPIDLATEWDSEQLPKKIDAIIHLSQSEYFREFPDYTENIFRINTLSTLKLLDYGRRINVKSFIYASSAGIYGDSCGKKNEETEIKVTGNLGFYLSTKLCSEVLIKNFSTFITTIILRFFFIYGEGQRKSMLVPRLVENIANGRAVTLQGKAGVITNPTFVSDAVHALISALQLKDSHIINVAGPQSLTLKDICKIIGQQIKKDPIFIYQKAKPRHLMAQIDKMSTLLGSPKVTFKEGIKKYLKTI